jgi:uncharacterized coiled-coil protein SlyX
MKNTLLVFAFIAMALAANTQTSTELSALQAQKSAELGQLQTQLAELTGRVESLQNEVEDLNDQLTPYPRWDIGALGNLGFSFSSFSDWLPKSQPNTTAFNIGFAGNGFANLEQRKYFWRNNANLTLGWLKFNDRDNNEDEDEFNVSADALAASSLFGYKLSEKLALSALAEYRSSILDDKFNNPGYLDLGAGVTWTPITDLVVVVHPLNYNLIFSDSDFDFKSTLGAKVVVDYKKLLTKNLAWRTNLSAFASYEGFDYSNWTWTNGLTTAVKGLGIGIDFGLRQNEQEALSVGRTDNPLQSYWIVGLAYAL